MLVMNDVNEIKNVCKESLQLVKECIEKAEDVQLTNEQFFLSYEMCLNNLSCRDHNKSWEDFEILFEDFVKHSV